METIEDFSNGKYVKDAIAQLLEYQVPEYELPNEFIFKVLNNTTNFLVETNIDFKKANEFYHKRISPKHSSLSVSYLLSQLMSARSDWYYSSHFSSEVATDEISNIILNLKFKVIIP
ncbi:MAG: hypothetical protein M3209_08995 [Acidobacteriota bacterium]|nr:hypothetical protein [Acidobacteriota bacterium]